MSALTETQVKRVGNVQRALAQKFDAIKAAVPKQVSPERLLRLAIVALEDNPKLLECSDASLVDSITQAAQLGVEVSNVMGEAYIVPYGVKGGGKKANLQLGYKGLIKLARNSGEVAGVDVQEVYQGDFFKFRRGLNQDLEHVPNESPDREKQPITHIYSIYWLVSGHKHFEVWTKEKIDRHKEQFAKDWQNPKSPWQTSWIAMAMKTVLRSPINRGLIPVSATLRCQSGIEQQTEVTIRQTQPADDFNQGPHLENIFQPHPTGGESQLPPESDWGELLATYQEKMGKAKTKSGVERLFKAFEEGGPPPEVLDAAVGAYQERLIELEG